MLIATLKEALPYAIKAKITLLLWGDFGKGKSSVPKQFCDAGGHRMFDLRLGSQEVGDLLGLADFVTDKEGNKTATKFFRPDWLKDAFDFCNNNPDKLFILFLDEINRARRDVLAPVFQIALDYRLHMDKFPPNMYVIAAANPNSENYVVTDINSDDAFASRFCHIKFLPSVSEWIDHAEETQFDSDVVAFIKEQPAMLESKQEDFNLDFVKPSRRNWDQVSKLRKIGTPDSVLKELAYGLVGFTATLAFMESLKNAEKPPKPTEILSDYENLQARIKKLSSNENSRVDILKISCDSLVKHIEKMQENKKKLAKNEESNLSKFLLDIPLDLSFATCKELWMLDNARKCFEDNEELRNRIKKARNMA